MNKVGAFIVVATLAFAAGCRNQEWGPDPFERKPAPADRTGEITYATKPGDTLASVAKVHGLSFGELFIANERLLFQHWKGVAEGKSQTLEEALLKLSAEEQNAVAAALAKPPEDWLASDKRDVAAASEKAGFQFGKQASAAGARGLGDLLGAGTVLVIPRTADAPADVRELAKQVAGNAAIVFYDEDNGSRNLARWFAQGLRVAGNKGVSAVVVVSAAHTRTYDDKLNVEEREDDSGVVFPRTAVALAATKRPAAIVLLYAGIGPDEWSADDELWAKSLPPVFVRYVSDDTDEPDGLTKLAKASKGRFLKVDK